MLRSFPAVRAIGRPPALQMKRFPSYEWRPLLNLQRLRTSRRFRRVPLHSLLRILSPRDHKKRVALRGNLVPLFFYQPSSRLSLGSARLIHVPRYNFRSGRVPMNSFAPFNRRQFLSNASRFGALYALAGSLPLSAFASAVADDPRVSQTPIADAGFASVRKIGDGLYATISDTSKGFTTICNGGFLVGKDAGLLLEAYGSAPGAAFQMDAYRKVTQVPAPNALLTHYHFDHSMGSSFYGANGIQLWAHSAVSKRINESYVSLQGADRAAVLAPIEKRIKDAKTDVARQHAQGDLGAVGNVFDMAN